MERMEERKATWYRVPEAPWVRSELEGLSQSPIDHGIQPVHDPMTLTIKLRKTRAEKEREQERERKIKQERRRERKREKENELDPVTVNSARGFMEVRRRRITPVVSRYILKSRAHACKSRTKLRSCADEIKIVENLVSTDEGVADLSDILFVLNWCSFLYRFKFCKNLFQKSDNFLAYRIID